MVLFRGGGLVEMSGGRRKESGEVVGREINEVRWVSFSLQ